MKLATFCSAAGEGRIGAVVEGKMVDLTAAEPRLPSDMLSLVQMGAQGLALAEKAAEHAQMFPLNEITLRAPIMNPPAFLGVGLNYIDHVREAHLEMPAEPTVFNKQVSSLVGSGAEVLLPELSDQLDYEGELAVVVGQARRGMGPEEAIQAIFGYLIVNDLSLRDIQFASPTVTMGKSFDTHGPCGPWIVTADEISDAQELAIQTRVNGAVRQSGTTADMVISCAELLVYLSRVMTPTPATIA